MLAEIPGDCGKKYKYKGEQRAKTVLVDTEKKPISLSALAKNTNAYFWYRRKVSEGTKGPIVYGFTRRRVNLSGKGLPQQEVWMIIRRSMGKNPEYSYYISNASSSVRLPLFVWLSGMRWAIEQCFEETKSELDTKSKPQILSITSKTKNYADGRN